MEMDTVGKTLFSERKRKGMTQAELGRSVRMSRNTVAAIEKGTFKEVGIRKVEALLNQLGYTLTVKKLDRRPNLNDLQGMGFHDE